MPATPSEPQPNEAPVESSIINPVDASGPHDHGISVVPGKLTTRVSDVTLWEQFRKENTEENRNRTAKFQNDNSFL